MKNIHSILIIFSLLFCAYPSSKAQDCSTFNLREQSEIPSTCSEIMMTMIRDQLGRPYLYIANKEAGLTIFDISEVKDPKFILAVPASMYDTLDVMNVYQEGNYLYLALGNHFTNPQAGGMAIIDVSDPENAEMTDYYVVSDSDSGAGIVKVEGKYAYLGAMKSGLVILDISNKSSISFVSQFIPDINFPVINPNPDLYNARGMEIKDGIVYLCYDAGGLRIVNCQNKSKPLETGHYANPALFSPFNLPRAYNNIILDDTLVYISVDYCGLEVLNISDTSNIRLTGWWNPFDCPNNNWFSSPVHSNELYYNKDCQRLFVSTGKSDMMVLDISDPTQPSLCHTFGETTDNLGTWGVSGYGEEIYVSYICALVPFISSRSSVKILNYSPCRITNVDEEFSNPIRLFPNPGDHQIFIEFEEIPDELHFEIVNSIGRKIKPSFQLQGSTFVIPTDDFPNGIYFLSLKEKKGRRTLKFIVKH